MNDVHITDRIREAQDAERRTIFVVPYGDAFLKVHAWQTQDGDFDDDNIIQVDLFGDKACTRPVAEEIQWENLDPESLFLQIREEQIKREDRLRRREEAMRNLPPAIRAEMDRDLTRALSLAPAFDSIFSRFAR